ncbi:hypothetical protein B0H63DRAFT_247591 [Podospora didyma]|uniref:Uncharacterized protein n=1 Tax=Podospora didyma TaxID=330526 RepID=A0AAE0NCA2_9PEZI|nr:hypothetical protein B0H63DRAFT_247591 [Podospora didyma]
MSPFLGLDGGFGWLESRGDTVWRPQSNANVNGTGNGLFQTAANISTTQQMFFNELKFAAAKSIRTSTIILATFNTVAAFATAMGILFDAYYREKRNNKKFKFSRRNGCTVFPTVFTFIPTVFTFVPTADVFPLAVSFAIIVQSVTFAVAQSTGLDALFGTGCTMMAQFMLPAVFLAPYTQLVFGLEIAMRALKKNPFAPRGKWDVSICLFIISMLTLANFLVADFDQSPNFCLTSLFWFVAHYSVGCFGLLVGIVSTLLICAVVIFVRLHRSIEVEVTARVSASRTVYYLALAIISNGFMLPYFFAMAFISQRNSNGNHLTLAMVASVVANVSGLMTGGLYLFLKSNTLSTISPRDKAGEYERRKLKYKIRRADDTDLDGGFDSHIMNPVTGPGSLRRTESDSSLISTEKVEDSQAESRSLASTATYTGQDPNPLRSNAVYPPSSMPKKPEPARFSAMSSAIGHMRKRSYSLFPNNAPSIKSSFTLLPATTYSPFAAKERQDDSLKPPPSMRNLAMRGHRRDSSLISSATVQIGLRLSSVEDMPPVVTNTVAVRDPHVYDLECPLVAQEKAEAAAHKRPAALDTSVGSPRSIEIEVEVEDDSPKRDPVRDAKMKTLPPVPNRQSIKTAVDEGEMLSPSIYSPVSPSKLKLPSPRGVGFTMPRSKSNAGTNSPRSPPMRSPSRRATEDDGPTPAKAKGDWI